MALAKLTQLIGAFLLTLIFGEGEGMRCLVTKVPFWRTIHRFTRHGALFACGLASSQGVVSEWAKTEGAMRSK